jgi:predicted methyltransferase
MLNLRGLAVVSTCTLLACGGESPPPAAAPPAAQSAAPAPAAPPTLSSTAAPAAGEPAQPTQETPEKKKADALRALQEDRAKWQEQDKAELARWTPELHAAAKALADKSYPSGASALRAAIAGKHRKPGDAERDKFRHPLETLAFFGFKPTLSVLEVSPGGGWYTELLAPALAAKGKLFATTADPSGPEDQQSTLSGQRYKAFLEKSPELYGKVQTIVVDDKAPSLGLDGTLDMVLVMRATHEMVRDGTLTAWLTAMHKALKPGGVLGIEQHRALSGADPLESSKNGYVPEKWLIEQCEAAGFKLAGTSEVNANPKDTKDYAVGVWALPPAFRNGDKDRDKYLAIGESDRMTLKLVKVRSPGAASDAKK